MASIFTVNERVYQQLPIVIHQAGFGWMVNLAPLLILTTHTPDTETCCHIALEYRQHGSKIYLLAPANAQMPAWYDQLQTQPQASVKIGRDCYSVSASPVTHHAEAQRALFLFRKSYTLTDQFKVIRLDVCNQPAAIPAISADRKWIVPALLLTWAFIGVAYSRLRLQTPTS